MRAVRFHRHGGVAELRCEEIPPPEPAAGEVLVRIEAAALNGFDPMMLEGSTGLQVPLPMIPCGDLAGRIAQLGPGVDRGRYAPEQPVSIYPILPEKGMMGEVTAGGLCEYVAVPTSVLVPIPEGVSSAQAAALPVAYGTALRMLHARGTVRAGERLLVLGATGGVGVGVIQLARLLGAEVIACGRGAARCARLREIGAHDVIDTAEENVRSAVIERYGKPDYAGQTSGGVDVVINYIGGDEFSDSLKVLRQHGRVLVCGATAGYLAPVDMRYLWSFEQQIIGSNGWLIEDQVTLLQMVADGQLDPVLHAVRDAADVRMSYQELMDRQVVGKSVLLP
ncbi:MAG: zinc-binding dehydrogenase [Pseudomonadota bacterium]